MLSSSANHNHNNNNNNNTSLKISLSFSVSNWKPHNIQTRTNIQSIGVEWEWRFSHHQLVYANI